MSGNVIEFPKVVHLRCTESMAGEVKARGGARWLRGLINANTRPPGDPVILPPEPPRNAAGPKKARRITTGSQKKPKK